LRYIDRRKGWWTPWEIRFFREQVIWLIEWLTVLGAGQWPAIPLNESWARHKRPMGRAYFETPAQVFAEITDRLDQCGQDGEIVKDTYLWKKSDREICIAYKMDVFQIDRHVNSALAYISGWKRKWTREDNPQTYAEFRWHGWIPKSREVVAERRGLSHYLTTK